MPESAIPEIQRFKTNYVATEDRLRFACEMMGGGSEVFWLTQRLSNALVKRLLEWLDKSSVQDPRFADHAHRMAQQSAMAGRTKGPAVSVPDTPGWLVRSIDFKTAKTGVTLLFKGDDGRVARLGFNAQRLRQWLNVLQVQYRRSNWQADIWPAWMNDLAEAPPADRGLLH